MRLALILALLPGLAAPALADEAPKLTKAEALQLFAAAGFAVTGGEIDNHCGQKADPALTFADLNGDGVAEAVFLDKGGCYPGGHWIAIVTKRGAAWAPVLMAPAVAEPIAHRTNGWYDLSVDFGGAKGVMAFDGTRYMTAAAAPGGVEPMRPPKVAAVPAQPAAPAPAPPAAAGDGLPKARPGEVPVAIGETPTPDQAAAVQRVMGKEFADDAKLQNHPIAVGVGLADLNGDGRPDLIFTSDDSIWCGSSGCSAWILMGTPSGYSGTAIDLPNTYGSLFVRKEMHHGMHDLRFDDANYIFRWTGREYR